MKILMVTLLDGSETDFLASYHTRKTIATEGHKINLLTIQSTTKDGKFAYYFIYKDHEIIASKSIFSLIDHYQKRYKSEETVQ